jgi:hypothetical protein
MATARSRITKGRRFQKTVMEKIKECFDLDDEAIRTPIGAEAGTDIRLTKKAKEKVRLSIECKNMKSLNIWKALEQAKANKEEGCDEAVIFKRGDLGSHKTYICVPLSHYLELRSND